MEPTANSEILAQQVLINKSAKMEALLLDSGGTVNAYALNTCLEITARQTPLPANKEATVKSVKTEES